MERQYANEVVGLNNRMTDIHAAIGRVQLTKVAAWTAKRQENAAWLDANLQGVVVPPVREGCTHVYHQYTVRVDGVSGQERDRMVGALREEHKIGCGVYYPIPNHELVSLARFAPADELPETARAAAEVISLPVHPSLSQEDLERVATAVSTVVRAGS
jgi:dTDP-4-amino-4,6-dideoxygalactose transaminase